MDQKTWRWRRNASEKTVDANGTTSLSLERKVEEDPETELGSSRCPSNLSDRLASTFCDCAAKEEIIRLHAGMAEQALAGQEMAEAEAASLKQELEKALQQGEAAEQRLAELEAALKDCMQEIESLRGEQDERLQNAFSKAQQKLEGKLAESNRRISNLTAENTNLMNALLCKDRLIEDLDKVKAQLEAEYDMLMARLDSAEKENDYLKYECCVMEEELKVRNEERENSRRLESECKQLRGLVRKPDKGSSFLTERTYDVEEENNTLREILSLSDSEVRTWRIKCGKMASRLAEVEAQLRELAVSGLRMGDSETWASALLEHEQSRKGNIKKQPESLALEIGAFDGPVEIEKFAIVSSEENNKPGKSDSWLDEVLNVILEEHRCSKRSLGAILQDIKIVLGCDDAMVREKDETPSKISGFLPWKPSNSSYIEDKGHNTLAQMVEIQCALQGENRGIREKLRLASQENVALKEQLQEADQTIGSLRREVETLREVKGVIEEQIENQRLISEDLATQLTVAKAKLNEFSHKLSSLEVELEDKSNCCEELEGMCLELQLQLETLSMKESPNPDIDQLVKRLKMETIRNLGKQMNALASPETTLLDESLSTTTTITDTKGPAPASETKTKNLAPQRSSLRDRMLAEDNDNDAEDLMSPKVKEDAQTKPSFDQSNAKALPAPPLKGNTPAHAANLAIVPSKKPSGGFGFIRRMFLRKRGCTKMKSVPLQRNTSVLAGPRDVLLLV